MTELFQIRIKVRDYELDTNGHVGGAVYVQYSDFARWEYIRTAGVSLDALRARGLGPVNLETHIRYHRELRSGDEVDVSCAFVWGAGKTFQVVQELRRADGVLVAEVTGVSGLLELRERRLVADPPAQWKAVATAPHVMGL